MQTDLTVEVARLHASHLLAKRLKSIPQKQHASMLQAMLNCAELIRQSIVDAKGSLKNRVRPTDPRRGDPDQLAALYLDIAIRVTLNDSERERDQQGRRSDYDRLERLTEQQIDHVVHAARDGVEASVRGHLEAQREPGLPAGPAALQLGMWTTAAKAFELEHGSADDLAKLAAFIATIGDGKKKSAPQVAALALVQCGYKNAEIVRTLDLDDAEVRRFVKPARRDEISRSADYEEKS
jgi:hypothetical protein